MLRPQHIHQFCFIISLCFSIYLLSLVLCLDWKLFGSWATFLFCVCTVLSIMGSWSITWDPMPVFLICGHHGLFLHPQAAMGGGQSSGFPPCCFWMPCIGVSCWGHQQGLGSASLWRYLGHKAGGAGTQCVPHLPGVVRLRL